MNKQKMKKYIKEKFKEQFGFSPTTREIIILECDDQYLRFLIEINGIEYVINKGKIEFFS